MTTLTLHYIFIEYLTGPVLPNPQGQNMTNCVSEYAKQESICKFLFRYKKSTGKKTIKIFHPIVKFSAQSKIHINTF